MENRQLHLCSLLTSRSRSSGAVFKVGSLLLSPAIWSVSYRQDRLTSSELVPWQREEHRTLAAATQAVLHSVYVSCYLRTGQQVLEERPTNDASEQGMIPPQKPIPHDF